jgi:hypothetical protein
LFLSPSTPPILPLFFPSPYVSILLSIASPSFLSLSALYLPSLSYALLLSPIPKVGVGTLWGFGSSASLASGVDKLIGIVFGGFTYYCIVALAPVYITNLAQMQVCVLFLFSLCSFPLSSSSLFMNTRVSAGVLSAAAALYLLIVAPAPSGSTPLSSLFFFCFLSLFLSTCFFFFVSLPSVF